MKILVLSFYYKPDLSAGSFRMSALVSALTELENVEVDIITSYPNRYSSFVANANTNDFDYEAGIKVHRIKIPNHNNGMRDQAVSFLTYYKETLKLTKNEEYDLIFATSSRLFTAFLGARISSRDNIPLFLDIRDIFTDTLKAVLSKNLSTLISPIINVVENYTFNKASHINLVSKGFEPYFLSKYPDKTYTYFTNGIDDEFIETDFTKPSAMKGKKIKLLYAGNVGEGQGLHLIVPALSRELGDNYEIEIIGDGGKKDDLIDACLTFDNVRIYPPVDRSELINIYREADILFLHLNDYRAFDKVLPSKIFEYAASGKPILAGVTGFPAEFLKQVSNAEVFYPRNAIEGKKSVERLRLSDSDRQEFVEKYQRSKIMRELARVIYSYE